MIEEEEDKPLKKYLKGEGEQVEYKQTLNDEFKIARTICSMANTKGGTLLIGVRDDKTVSGVDPEEEKYFLLNAARFRCRPPVPVEIEELYVPDEEEWREEKVVLKVTIPESSAKPHYAENKKGEWIAYQRIRDQNLLAGDTALNLMQQENETGNIDLSKNEKRLVDFLKNNNRITLKRYSALVNISPRRARKELQDALNKGVIRILEHEKEPYYVL